MNDTPSAARVVKTTAFTIDEWKAIETLMTVLKEDRFTKLCRIGLRLLADQQHVKWPAGNTE